MAHAAYLDFRVPSAANEDDDLEAYKRITRLEYTQKKPVKTNHTPRTVRENPKNGQVFLFDDNSENTIVQKTTAYPGGTKIKTSRKNTQRSDGGLRKNSSMKEFTIPEHLSAKHSEAMPDDLVVYKMKRGPVLKAYPGRDPNNLRVTTNSRSNTSISMNPEAFELTPTPTKDLARDSRPQSKESVSSRSLYGLSQHSYVTPQPPWVNKTKIYQSRSEYRKILSQGKAQMPFKTLRAPSPVNDGKPSVIMVG